MAMAPEQVGIGIRRHFTRAGVHPYDSVAWEKRDARIPNYKSGGDAFFQPGVEFPVTWSQNATNIVAQKYFRGQLDTPGRESSLRQVIDRVADTISDWGVRDGYFVDEAEADAFRDELKYLLVHQRAAFNSPVWFNIGVKGVPAQASACQPYHALVSTVDGLVPIGRLVEDSAVGTKVFDAHGVTSIVAVKANGTRPVLRIHTKAGYTLDVTPDHLVWRVSGVGAGRFVEAGDLKPADKLEWHRTESWGAGTFDSSEVAEAALAGWLQCDGFVGQYEGTNRSLTIEAMTVTPAELAWVTAAIDKVFPSVHRHERKVVTQAADIDCRRTRLYGRALADFVNAWGLRARGVEMEIPFHLFTAPLPVVAAYLRSVFQAEGYVSIRERAAVVGLDMISEQIVRGVQHLLLRFGIFSRVRFQADPRPDRKGCWSLSIRTAGDRRRFADEIGFIDARKAEKLETSFDLPNGLAAKVTKTLEIDRIEPIGEMEVYDIQTESGEYLSGNLRVHNCFILAVDDTMSSILNWYVEEGTIFKGGSGSGINLSNIRSSVEPLAGGGTASGPVSFMRGADASAGTIKCLHADTELVTDHGSMAIRSVAPGWQVLTRHGFRTVTAVHDNGVRPLVRVRTALGDEILCTPEHRFRVRTTLGEMWRQAGELGPDDYVVVDLAHTDAGSPQRLVADGADGAEVVLPDVLDEAFAVWLGWAHGEGRLRPVPGSGALAVHLDGEDKALVERYRAFTTSVFGRRAVAGMSTARGGAAPPATLCAPAVARFLRDNGLWRVGAASVPRPVRSSPAAVRAAFLAGLFESDGHVQHGCPTLWTRRRELALDVHRLLLSVGIPSKVSQARPPASVKPGGTNVSPDSAGEPGGPGGRGVHEDDDTAPGAVPTSGPGLWRVRVVGGEGVRRFAKLVGFVSEGKARLLETALAVAKEEPEAFEASWFFPHVDAELDRLGFAVGASLRAAIGSYRHDAHPYGMSLPRAAGIAAAFPAELEGALARFAQGEEFYVPVTVEPAGPGDPGVSPDGTGPTFDLTVADIHEYLVHSVVTHNSGGKTRRAAKMVILNADHPDVEHFIWCKAVEERKARALAAAGFDMDLDGVDSHSTQYQNANNSVRVTDEFMQAVVDDDDWDLKAVKTGEPTKTLKARALLRQIAEAAWECADPGMQFDTTINRWHTASNTGRINASNPCFPGDARVHTDKGLVRFDELVDRVRLGESFGVYTHDATNSDAPAERLEITAPEAVMITGFNEIVKLSFSNGMELRCTPNHKIFTVNRGYVPAEELTESDEVKVLDLPAPAVNADWRLPVSTDVRDYSVKGDWSRSLRLPEKWTEDFGHYLGWLVGDGCISENMVTTVYGNGDDQNDVLPKHRALLAWLNGDREPKPSVQANGTLQLRQTRRVIARFLEGLGIEHSKASDKKIPWAIEKAPSEVVAAFLRGLFDADGCVYDGENSRYVGMGSASRSLLQDVQRLLSTFGIFSRIYATRKGGEKCFPYVGKDSVERTYTSKPLFDLRIANRSIERFAGLIGFSVQAKHDKLATLLLNHEFYDTATTVRLAERVDDGVALTYNLCEPRNHSYIVNNIIIRNCSEYVHLDNSACNLASMNLMRFLNDDGKFDVEGFKAAVEVIFTAQEILVGNAEYPTQKIGENARAFRQLGIGYANLGALLMAQGLPYDSDEGRAWAAAITALLTGQGYATSARTAGRMGPFAGYAKNKEPMLNVLRMHRAEVDKIDTTLAPPELVEAARGAWDDAVGIGETHGVRNSQASVLAPTGCLVGGSLVATDRGLVRLRSLGDPDGPQWQDLDVDVLTDEGTRPATRFYVNGLEPVVDATTARGYRIQGTTKHRIKLVDANGEWVWRRFADLRAGDRLPLALGQMVGDPRPVSLPPLAETSHWTGEHHARVPRRMTPELAELVGYFMGDGSLHAKGLRLCVSDTDPDVVDHLELLVKSLFGIETASRRQQGYTSVEANSVRLAEWWEACGFAKRAPSEGHWGKGYTPHVPDAVLHTNDPEVYRAFLRGLHEADGTVTAGYPSWTTTSMEFSHDVQTLLLALGFITTRKFDTSGRGSRLAVLRLLNKAVNARWLEEIGFISARKARAVDTSDCLQSARYDHIPVSRELIDRVSPSNDRNRKVALMEYRRSGTITRRLAEELLSVSGDAELGRLLRFFYDTVASAELGEEALTYDLSVPDNVTYVANGFVSHNTIGLMMDCDTTGVEPDLALTKAKKLVGGGTMFIVNQTVPRALRQLGYSDEQVEAIVAWIDEHKTILGAPGLRVEHLPVFACAMGDNTIHYMGHVRMMAAVQPFISGAISKCVVGETLISTADGLVRIGGLHQGESPDTFRHEVIEVASLGGTHKTDAFYYGGQRPVREAVLRSGHRVVGTPNHRLLVAGEDGLDWRRLDEIKPGDHVAVRYGADLWSPLPARFDDFVPSVRYGSQKQVRIPEEMTEELAFLLGAYVAEGHTTRTTWTVTITNSVPEVLERVAAAWRSIFGVEARIAHPVDRCPGVIVSSKTIVEFLEHLGCGARASAKRIPDTVLCSPRSMILSFLEGLFLDGFTAWMGRSPKVAICVDSPGLLDDLQVVLTNLGVLHSRIEKLNRQNGKTYGEVYAAGEEAQRLLRLVPFPEPHKAARAAEMLAASPSQSTADVVPGITPADLRRLIPRGKSGRGGFRSRTEFGFLGDLRTQNVSRRTLQRVAALPGAELPEWLRTVLDDGLHFSPVERIADAGEREVYDVSVPLVHAFVGNGIVNHNTINMPEEATVEEVEDLHIEAWRLGIKAIAIYRDNCKVGQPLSTQKKAEPIVREVERVVETIVLQEPVRQKLPRTRSSKTFSFRVADCHGYATVGEYEDGRPGEIFLKVAKQGSTMAGIMDAFAISVSHGLQYGVPLKAFVEMFINMRFEPAGITDDPEIRLAASLVDYIFRRLAVEYLPYEDRVDLGILTVGERTQPTLPGVEEASIPPEPSLDLTDRQSLPPSAPPSTRATAAPGPQAAAVPEGTRRLDAPYCYNCGMEMQRAGSCYVCSSCGATSGCS